MSPVAARWLRRIRGAVGMGVTWAAGWALFVVLLGLTGILLPGLGLEVVFEAADDELLPAAVVPAFVGGVVFSGVLGIAGRRRRFDELSLRQFAVWGAMGGLLLGLIPAAAVAMGAAGPARAVAIVVSVALLSAVSASGSLMLARVSEDRELRAGAEEVAATGAVQREARELLGDGG